ncbi:MAG: hypothetical protein NXI31_14205 [bacterium]|nr:hypothetical protein [bacterium]
MACTSTGPQSPEQGAAAAEVSYTNDIRPIVSNYCATCHHGDDPDGDFVLDTYEDVRGMVESGELLARINDERDPMPPAGMMSQRQRDLFRAWQDGGYLNVGDPAFAPEHEPFEPPLITPVDVTKHGFDLLERLQGHWVGKMNLMGQDMPWFAWDYRAIAPSHVHAIFEGGTLGNLFTSFFVADLRGTRTIMARNGGLLNGIYRTSYFVLDRVQKNGKSTEYRLVDAYGGEGIMWMNLAFTGESLVFTSHTSRLGLAGPPKRHMRFEGRRMHPELARSAAKAVGFPALDAAYDFADGLPLPDWGAGVPVTSYSYIWEDKDLSVLSLAKLCGDPIRIDQMPYLATLRVEFERGARLRDMPMEIYLSRSPLTAADGKFLMRHGYPSTATFDGVLMFSRLTACETEMTFTYLHPGTYYVTAVCDKNGDGYPSAGDLSHKSVKIEVLPRSAGEVRLPAVDVQN